jgi:hypothetical protein
MARDPIGMRNISTTYQEAYQTLDGNAQVRKIGDRLWEILARGGVAVYEKSKDAALTRGFELAASVTRRASPRKKKGRRR